MIHWVLLLLVRDCHVDSDYIWIVTDGKDYSGGMMVIDVSDGMDERSFEIAIINTGNVECDETFNVTIKSVSGCGVTIGNTNNSEVKIRDNTNSK